MAKEYNFREIEQKWHRLWTERQTYKVTEDERREKFYVLNMFPYPSGAGLHVGHPLGYIASDIYARYKRVSTPRRLPSPTSTAIASSSIR